MHIRLFLICFAWSFCLWGCTKDIIDITLPEEEAPIHLNICVLGNSYSNDSFSYVPFILLKHGITCKIDVYYRGSGSIRDLAEQWNNYDKYDVAELDGKLHNRLHFSIDTRKEKKWQKRRIMSASEIIRSDQWDIVTIQQVSSLAKNEASYYPYLQTVIETINEECPYTHALVWFMAYNRARDNANEENLNTQKRIIQSFPFDWLIPVATAVFDCQENKILSELGDSQYKRMYAADNVHLQEGLPCYVAALTVVQSILNALRKDDSVLGDSIRPSQAWIKSIGGITPDGESIGVTEENCALAQRVAIQANLHPFEIIPAQ